MKYLKKLKNINKMIIKKLKILKMEKLLIKKNKIIHKRLSELTRKLISPNISDIPTIIQILENDSLNEIKKIKIFMKLINFYKSNSLLN